MRELSLDYTFSVYSSPTAKKLEFLAEELEKDGLDIACELFATKNDATGEITYYQALIKHYDRYGELTC
jgi:hypothetical protein